MRSLRTVSLSPKVAREGNSNPPPLGVGSVKELSVGHTDAARPPVVLSLLFIKIL